MNERSVPQRSTIRFAGLLAAASLVLGASVLTRAAVGSHAREVLVQDQGVADELAKVGEQVTEKICTECHPFDDIVLLRRTPREWKEQVTLMATKGAIATQDQFATVRQYLTRYYGRVRVNSAAAEDLVAVLGLSAKEAEAVVAHRTAKGKFADLASFLTVPGVDKAKLEADPDALVFD